jgi:hypothetical protein
VAKSGNPVIDYDATVGRNNEKGIRNQESGIRNQESGMRDEG